MTANSLEMPERKSVWERDGEQRVVLDTFPHFTPPLINYTKPNAPGVYGMHIPEWNRWCSDAKRIR